MIAIENNIPIPGKKIGPDVRYSELPLSQMEVGDSFVWPIPTVAGVKVYARKKFGIELFVKKESVGSWRIWRTK